MLNKGSNRPFGGKARSAYRLLLIGDKQAALAHSRSTAIEIFKGRAGLRPCSTDNAP